MSKTKLYLIHYAVLIFAASLLSFWCYKTLVFNPASNGLSGWINLHTLLAIALVVFITLVAVLLLRRHSHWLDAVTQSLRRMAAGHWETIPDAQHPIVTAYNDTVNNLQSLLDEHNRQKEQLRLDVNRHATALRESGVQLNQTMLELKNIQSLMAQAEKHRSLSAIVSGFAHEINNPLTGILGYIDLMELQTDLSEQSQKRLASIKTQAQRIKGIIFDLSQLDPDGKQVKMPINLTNLLEKLVKISLSKHEKAQISLETKFVSVETLVFGNHFALWQVFEGLLENAIEACLEHAPTCGHIVVENRCLPDKHTVITIQDNGGGFKDIGKAFDPFYTTKNRTNKRGIGLSLAYKIVVEHGGTINIKNHEPGALVTVTLPLQAPPPDSEKK